MKSEILIQKINSWLRSQGSSVKAVVFEFGSHNLSPSIQFVMDDPFVTNNLHVSLSDEFYEEFAAWIKKYITDDRLQWNNTKTILSIWVDSNTSFITD